MPSLIVKKRDSHADPIINLTRPPRFLCSNPLISLTLAVFSLTEVSKSSKLLLEELSDTANSIEDFGGGESKMSVEVADTKN